LHRFLIYVYLIVEFFLIAGYQTLFEEQLLRYRLHQVFDFQWYQGTTKKELAAMPGIAIIVNAGAIGEKKVT